VQSTGWDNEGNQPASNKQSWLREHNRFVFIIFVGLFFIGLLIWYIVRSVKGMRKRLVAENNAQLYMMQQATGNDTTQQQQQQQHPIPETSVPPPAYKQEEYHPTSSYNNNQQQPHY
jgi:flagellar biosynthesis/type III secretory pathway M-ring protein FliF/YscJ